MISYEDFKKVELKVGQILSAEKVPETDKLLKLSVDFGFKTNSIRTSADQNSPLEVSAEEKDIRQIISGIAPYFQDVNELVGKKFVFCTNLEPRTIRGLESFGMILGIGGEGEPFSLLSPSNLEVKAGVSIN